MRCAKSGRLHAVHAPHFTACNTGHAHRWPHLRAVDEDDLPVWQRDRVHLDPRACKLRASVVTTRWEISQKRRDARKLVVATYGRDRRPLGRAHRPPAGSRPRPALGPTPAGAPTAATLRLTALPGARQCLAVPSAVTQAQADWKARGVQNPAEARRAGEMLRRARARGGAGGGCNNCDSAVPGPPWGKRCAPHSASAPPPTP